MALLKYFGPKQEKNEENKRIPAYLMLLDHSLRLYHLQTINELLSIIIDHSQLEVEGWFAKVLIAKMCFVLHSRKFWSAKVFSYTVLYTGMMYHEKKEVDYWKTIYSVVKDLDVLKKVALSL